jgi:protein SCO1/2
MRNPPLNRRLLLAAFAAIPFVLPARAEDAVPEQPRRFMMEDAATGNVVNDDILLSKVSLLYFGYTHCPDICPTSLIQMADAMKALGGEASRVQPIFVTVDPARDTSAVMKDYVKSFDDRFVALRGPAAYTDAMVKAYNAKYEIQKPSGDDPAIYNVDHTASIAMIGPDGVLRKRFPYGVATAEITSAVQALLKEMPAP